MARPKRPTDDPEPFLTEDLPTHAMQYAAELKPNRPAVTASAGGGPTAQPAASRPTIGTVLAGRFELEECVAEGSLGAVYRVRDRLRVDAGMTLADAELAVKILDVGRRRDPGELRRLQRNAVRMQALDHPNIVRVYDLAQDGETSFFTMEWLEGEPLSRYLDRRRAAPVGRQRMAQVVAGVGAALRCAHDRDCVHGDLKPANVFLTQGGPVKLLDFHFGAAEGADTPTLTPEYASCEQLEGRATEPSDDAYAFACLIYRMMAGHRPFGRQTALAAEARGVQPERLPGLDELQWQTLCAALAFRRAERTVDVEALVTVFTQQPEKATGKAAGKPGRSRRMVLPIALVAVMMLGGFWLAARDGLPTRWLDFRPWSTPSSPAPAVTVEPAVVPRRPAADAPGRPEPTPATTPAPAPDARATDTKPAPEPGPPDVERAIPTPGSRSAVSPVPAVPDALAREFIEVTDTDQPLGFAETQYAVSEADGFARITVHAPRGHAGIRLGLTVAGGSATPGVDFVSLQQEVTFAPGETEAVIMLPLVNDSEPEHVEDILLRLDSGTDASPVARSESLIVVLDDDGR